MEKKISINQEKAIRHGNGPCIVLSGPGSGKTFVLTNRILNLICEYGISPENILVITFTRAAANEMKSRFKILLRDNAIKLNDMPSFGTFHSIFFEILKNDFGYNNNSLLRDTDERVYLSEVLESDKNRKVTSDTITNIIKDIKSYKLHNEREERFTPKYLSVNEFRRIYNNYQEKLFNNKKLDFSDMIIKCGELLSIHSDVLTYYQERYKYILIDEFQDINKSQYDLVKMICRNRNLVVVGDDDQSIYKFRGSHPRVMNDFLKDYRGAKKIYLTDNYRCARKIVKFSKLVIDNNKDRFEKDLRAKRDDVGNLQIKAFVDNDLFGRMKSAYERNELYRERKFLLQVNGEQTKKIQKLKVDTEETTIVQGIIDACFIEDGKYVIVDYKTDNVDAVDMLKEEYAEQLNQYEQAVKQISGKEVAEKIIYSVKLGEVINV